MVLGWFGCESYWPDPRMTLPLLSLLAAGELELLLLPHDTGAKMWERRIYEQTKSISWGLMPQSFQVTYWSMVDSLLFILCSVIQEHGVVNQPGGRVN